MKLIGYWIDRITRSSKGLIPQEASNKDYIYEENFVISGSTVEKIDLRVNFKPVLNQKSSEACTGFAVGAMCEYLLETEFSKGWRKISPLYNWYWAKVKHGWENQNKGAWLRYSLDALFDKGFIYYQTMPFTTPYTRAPTQFDNLMGEMVKTLYLTNKRFGYYLLKPKSEEIKDALKNKNPVVFGMYLNNSFYGNSDGIIQDTVKNNSAHAMVIVGFDDEKQHYIVRNSWGTSWGDDGYAYVPYRYLEANSFDLWTIRRKP